MPPLRVLLAENHVLMRAGLRLLLEQTGELTVVAEASNGAEALRLLAFHRPQIAVLDIAIEPPNGLAVLAALRAQSDVPVVMLTGAGSEALAVEALQRGAQDYLVKGTLNDQRARPASCSHSCSPS
ncbi:MAG: response regulator [Chloroflexales bacterium]|nr:response regulator [Chloroflexales bacterium]